MAAWVCRDSRKKQITMLLFMTSLHLMVLFPLSSFAAGMHFPHQDLQVEELLKRLNKPAIKSIKSPDGDIIDCVHVSQQPAFDHPLLKNHKIQMRPTSHPEGLFKNKNATKSKQSSNSIIQLWQLGGRCPEETIPIRRTTREDILRASSVERFAKKEHRTIPQPGSMDSIANHEYAVTYVQGEKYYGAKASINVWRPNVQQQDEFSLSQLWIVGGKADEDQNTIEAGWQVYPNLYGDNNTRLFIYWTSDSYKSIGCYNLECPGFIQTNNEIALGTTINPISGYGGSQFDIKIHIWKDPADGNWWMKLNDKLQLGYWPSSLFSHLADSASFIEWGGEVTNLKANGQHTTTQMGSGHFPREGFSRASFFRNLQVVDGSNNLKDPVGIKAIAHPQPSCYNIQTGSDHMQGNYFYHGGPGRNPNCL